MASRINKLVRQVGGDDPTDETRRLVAKRNAVFGIDDMSLTSRGRLWGPQTDPANYRNRKWPRPDLVFPRNCLKDAPRFERPRNLWWGHTEFMLDASTKTMFGNIQYMSPPRVIGGTWIKSRTRSGQISYTHTEEEKSKL